jgi:hypothetical protein
MKETEEVVVGYYVNELPEKRRELVREKMLASKWIPYEEQKPPSETRILAKYRDGSIYVEWFYGFQGEGILEITHWKPLIK